MLGRRQWDSAGRVVVILAFDQCVIKVDGYCRITTRNRRFLCLISTSTTDDLMYQNPYLLTNTLSTKHGFSSCNICRFEQASTMPFLSHPPLHLLNIHPNNPHSTYRHSNILRPELVSPTPSLFYDARPALVTLLLS